MNLPRYRVTMDDGEFFDIHGNPECRQYGALFFVNEKGEILKLLAPGQWKEVTLIENGLPVCSHCGRPF